MRDNQQLDLFNWKPVCEIIPFPHDRLIGRARKMVDLSTKTTDPAMRFVWKSEIETLDRAMAAAGISIEKRDQELEAFTALVRDYIADADGDAWGASGGDAA